MCLNNSIHATTYLNLSPLKKVKINIYIYKGVHKKKEAPKNHIDTGVY